MELTLFERVGGLEGVMAAANRFYELVLDDELTRPFFESVDIDKQTTKLVSFMTWAFDGPDEYRGRDLREAHYDLVKSQGLGQEHFDAVVKHLRTTLQSLEMDPSAESEILTIIEGTRVEVLNL